MSLILDILEEAWNTTLNYKGVTVNLFGVPYQKNKRSFQSTLYHLKKTGLIIKNKEAWKITDAGKKYLTEHKTNLQKFKSPFKKGSPRKLILMFDIPEHQRIYRDWLRKQLKEYDFKMIQQSVWVGPSPLPNEFKLYMRKIGLHKLIKTFNLAKEYRK
ncbi:MAG: putative regulator [Candidatus Taylorbacteria bacterium]|nr:putative regulator [Candidatus Taylorbacteria bacterium]